MPGPCPDRGTGAPLPAVLRAREDRQRIFAAKAFRAVAYGALSGFLVIYLRNLGYSNAVALFVATLTLVGAALWNLLALPGLEARLGTRRALTIFGALFFVSALLLFFVVNFWVIVLAALLGGVGATTADNGPLASLDQAILPSTLRRSQRTQGFAWYNLIANFAGAGGALLLLPSSAFAPTDFLGLPGAPHPWILLAYLLLAFAGWAAYWGLSAAVEAVPPGPDTSRELPPESRTWVRDLSVLFGWDSFAGGLVINPVITVFFVEAWGADPTQIGVVLFGAGTAAGLSFLVASRLADRYGLLRTMVFTHIPSNLLLILVPLMPTFPLALGMFFARMSLSQMDVPTRQAYSMALVARRYRAKVASQLSSARGLPQSLSPFVASGLVGLGLLALPFYAGGGLKLGYDLLLWRRFRKVPVPGEARPGGASSPEEAATSAPSSPPD